MQDESDPENRPAPFAGNGLRRAPQIDEKFVGSTHQHPDGPIEIWVEVTEQEGAAEPLVNLRVRFRESGNELTCSVEGASSKFARQVLRESKSPLGLRQERQCMDALESLYKSAQAIGSQAAASQLAQVPRFERVYEACMANVDELLRLMGLSPDARIVDDHSDGVRSRMCSAREYLEEVIIDYWSGRDGGREAPRTRQRLTVLVDRAEKLLESSRNRLALSPSDGPHSAKRLRAVLRELRALWGTSARSALQRHFAPHDLSDFRANLSRSVSLPGEAVSVHDLGMLKEAAKAVLFESPPVASGRPAGATSPETDAMRALLRLYEAVKGEKASMWTRQGWGEGGKSSVHGEFKSFAEHANKLLFDADLEPHTLLSQFRRVKGEAERASNRLKILK